MATHSSILAWGVPWTEEPAGLYSPWGHKGSDTTEVTVCTHGGGFYLKFDSSLNFRYH